MHNARLKPPSEAELRSYAEKAQVTDRTLLKAMLGMPVRGRAGVRARTFLAEVGLLPTAPVEKKAGES